MIVYSKWEWLRLTGLQKPKRACVLTQQKTSLVCETNKKFKQIQSIIVYNKSGFLKFQGKYQCFLKRKLDLYNCVAIFYLIQCQTDIIN